MTQTLMNDFEEERPETVFPDTEKVLFLGGPKQGETVEVVYGDPVWKVISAPPPPTIMPEVALPAGGAMVVHSYIRRVLTLQDQEGDVYRRTVYVHESIPNEMIAQRLLMGALLSTFIHGGERVPQDELSEEYKRGPTGD